MNGIAFTEAPEFAPVVVSGKTVYITKQDFDTLSIWRQERIDNDQRYNTGPEICDPYVDAGEKLTVGGNVTGMELKNVLTADTCYVLERSLGKGWASPQPSECRPNPDWIS